MGYDVYFSGELTLSRPLGEKHAKELNELFSPNNAKLIEALKPDEHFDEFPWPNFTAGTNLIDINDTGYGGFTRDAFKWLITGYLAPRRYKVNGECGWEGDDPEDRGIIYVRNNQIESVLDEVTNPGPSWAQKHRKLEPAQLGTILAALRYYQKSGLGDPDNRPLDIHDIATVDDGISLNDQGIEELCELLNLSGDIVIHDVDVKEPEPVTG